MAYRNDAVVGYKKFINFSTILAISNARVLNQSTQEYTNSFTRQYLILNLCIQKRRLPLVAFEAIFHLHEKSQELSLTFL